MAPIYIKLNITSPHRFNKRSSCFNRYHTCFLTDYSTWSTYMCLFCSCTFCYRNPAWCLQMVWTAKASSSTTLNITISCKIAWKPIARMRINVHSIGKLKMSTFFPQHFITAPTPDYCKLLEIAFYILELVKA